MSVSFAHVFDIVIVVHPNPFESVEGGNGAIIGLHSVAKQLFTILFFRLKRSVNFSVAAN